MECLKGFEMSQDVQAEQALYRAFGRQVVRNHRELEAAPCPRSGGDSVNGEDAVPQQEGWRLTRHERRRRTL